MNWLVLSGNMVSGNMDCDCREIWTTSNDAWWRFLCHDKVVSMDGKFIDETNIGEPQQN